MLTARDMLQPEKQGLGGFVSPASALSYILSGRAIVTLQSAKTNKHYTFEVARGHEKDEANSQGLVTEWKPIEPAIWFVKILTDSDRYVYIGAINGHINEAGQRFIRMRTTRKSTMTDDSIPVRAMNFCLLHLSVGRMPPDMKVFHDGRCGRCRKVLTRPDSIELGLGPDCAQVEGILHPLNCEAISW